jgi:hypothetical protein
VAKAGRAYEAHRNRRECDCVAEWIHRHSVQHHRSDLARLLSRLALSWPDLPGQWLGLIKDGEKHTVTARLPSHLQ